MEGLTFLNINRQISIIIRYFYYDEKKRKSQGENKNFFSYFI